MALGMSVASDIANALLKFYTKGPALLQTMQDRPLLRFLNAAKKNFSGGNQYISDPVKGAVMYDTAGFFVGYTEDEELTFAQAQNILRAETLWYECHAGLIISWTELKKDGITVTDGSKKTEHSNTEVFRLTSLLQDRLEDFRESWARAMNNMLWRDGSQDAQQVPGVLSFLTATPAVGTTAGLNRATYSWWRHIYKDPITPSEENQYLTKALRQTQRDLKRYGGKPNKWLAGSDFLDALENEIQAKGQYTVTGFTKVNDIEMGDVSLGRVGLFEYDPTLDDLSLSKYCYEFDSRRMKLRPMEGEENKLLTPERPYNYAVFLQSMTWTGALTVTQLNCHAVFSIA